MKILFFVDFLFPYEKLILLIVSEFEEKETTGGTPPSSTSTSGKTSSSIGASTATTTTNNPVLPLPTLYNGANDHPVASGSSNSASHHHHPRGTGSQKDTPTIQVLLYNMASMLAGVAAGYDVRLSNVSPIHPNLYPNR